MKVYVEAQSKADLIRRLAAGEEISGYNYSMFGGGGHYMLDDNLEDGTIIAIYTKKVQGNPVAKSWGTWTNGVLKAESFDAEYSRGYSYERPLFMKVLGVGVVVALGLGLMGMGTPGTNE